MITKNYSLLILMILIATKTPALVLNVPGNYSTIASAIQAASNSDTVLVEPGTYYENLNFRGKNIVLTSRYYLSQDSSFICSTIIDGSQPAFPDTGSCIILNTDEDSTTFIQGFTITGGTGTAWLDVHGAGTYREGGGIITEFSSPVIRWNHIVNNRVLNTTGVNSTGGGGIRSGDGHPKIYGNIIAHNEGRYGGGLVFNYCDNAEVKNNLIAYNEGGQSFGGGGIWATGTNSNQVLTVENNTIANNHVSGTGNYGGRGGGIFVFSVKINSRNNIIWGNTQTTGNAIAKFTAGVVNAEYSDIDFTYAGTGNINNDPLFIDTISFLISANSLCVDAGDTSSNYNDPSNSPGIAVFPSNGTQRNDMGVYGGSQSVYTYCNADPTFITEKYFSEKYDVVPNPAHDHFIIKSTENDLLEAGIYSIQGKKVFSGIVKCNSSIQLPSLPDGLYFLEIKSDKRPITIRKIIIKTNK